MVDVIFSDIPTDLVVHPVRGDFSAITNEEAVKRSIKNLLLTSPYERFFNANIGAGLEAYLFENIGRDTEFIITEKIKEVIKNYEPRANLYSVNVIARPDDNSYSATIVFSIDLSTQPTTLQLVLRRVR